ncbi:MAG: hypothetical protein AAB879_03630 [Patescibacteria group bacterium]
MNTTISFSIPVKAAKRTRRLARTRGFRSVSQYMRYLVFSHDTDEMISEDELVRRLRSADREDREGTLLSADSITNLLKKYG